MTDIIEPEPVTGGRPARTADVSISLIRTWVPIGVGALLAWLAAATHTVIPAGASATVGTVAAALVAAAYYAVARLLERAGSPSARTIGRYMLGGVVPPIYVDAATQARVLR